MKRALVGMTLLIMTCIATSTVQAAMMAAIDVDYHYTTPINTAGAGQIYTTEFDLSVTVPDLGVVDFDTFGYCVDPLQSISKGVTTFNLATLLELGSDTYYEVAWLVDEFAPGKGDGLSTEEKKQAAALQGLIWETVAGPRYTLTGPLEVLGYYANYSTALSSLVLTPELRSYLEQNYYVALHETKQDLILKIDNPVPEPATMILFGVGLAGLAGLRRGRKK